MTTHDVPARATTDNSEGLTAERLRELLDYDPQTGVFTWRPRPREHFKSDAAWRSWKTRYAGKATGTPSTKGYLKIWIDGGQYRAHRLAWLHATGSWPVDQVDHINRNPADNRLANLREADNAANNRNLGMRSRNTSGHTGVTQRGNSYRAQIRESGSKHSLGTYPTAEQAAAAYRHAADHLNFGPTHGLAADTELPIVISEEREV